MGSNIRLKLDHGRNNPRNSEGAFATLADDRIMFVYSHYYGKSSSDHATAELRARFSGDGGRTWSGSSELVVPNEGRLNVMSVSLLRLQDGRLALFYLRKNSVSDCRLCMRVSKDEGASWSKPRLCIPFSGYNVVNNDRVAQLRSGRILFPVSWHRTCAPKNGGKGKTHDSRGMLLAYYSDDGGRSWVEGDDWWALPVRSAAGIQEPGVVELRNGSLYGWCRTTTGRQWEFTSRDGGNTWTPPRPSRFLSPCSPMSVKRIPQTGDLLAVWNDHSARWGRPRQKLVNGRASGVSRGRTPLAAALSSNEGKTWKKARLVERDPVRGFCYTAIHFAGDAVLLAYCCGGGKRGGILQDLCVRRITLDWLYK